MRGLDRVFSIFVISNRFVHLHVNLTAENIRGQLEQHIPPQTFSSFRVDRIWDFLPTESTMQNVQFKPLENVFPSDMELVGLHRRTHGEVTKSWHQMHGPYSKSWHQLFLRAGQPSQTVSYQSRLVALLATPFSRPSRSLYIYRAWRRSAFRPQTQSPRTPFPLDRSSPRTWIFKTRPAQVSIPVFRPHLRLFYSLLTITMHHFWRSQNSTLTRLRRQ